MKTKAELLAHYAQKFPNTFCQLDAFKAIHGDMFADEDGDAMFQTFTDELMNGAAVRVLIPGNSPNSAKNRNGVPSFIVKAGY